MYKSIIFFIKLQLLSAIVCVSLRSVEEPPAPSAPSLSNSAGTAPDIADSEFMKKSHAFKNNQHQHHFIHSKFLSYCKELNNKNACFEVNRLTIVKTLDVDCKDNYLEVYFEYRVCNKELICEHMYHNGYLHNNPKVHINDTIGFKSNFSCTIRR